MAQIIAPSGQIQQVQLASVAQLGSLAQAQANQNMMVQAAAAAAANSNAVTSSTWSTTTVTTPSVTVQVRLLINITRFVRLVLKDRVRNILQYLRDLILTLWLIPVSLLRGSRFSYCGSPQSTPCTQHALCPRPAGKFISVYSESVWHWEPLEYHTVR